MSIKVFGTLTINDNTMQVSQEVLISFLIVETAMKNKLGVNLGGSITHTFLERCKKVNGVIPFELTDNPMETNVNCLFMGRGIVGDVDSARAAMGESLTSRMLRTQRFLCEVLKIKDAQKIILDINIEVEAQIETIEINVNNFCSTMLELYKQEEILTPSIRIIIIN